MILTELEKKKINKMTGELYELATDIRKGHVELNSAREYNITARNIQNQYKVLFTNELDAITFLKESNLNENWSNN